MYLHLIPEDGLRLRHHLYEDGTYLHLNPADGLRFRHHLYEPLLVPGGEAAVTGQLQVQPASLPDTLHHLQ